MPALFQVSVTPETPEKPNGWLGLFLYHGLQALIEQHSLQEAKRLSTGSIKPFRIGAITWQDPLHEEDRAEVQFQLAVLDDDLIEAVSQLLHAGQAFGQEEALLSGEIKSCELLTQTTYTQLYERHATEVRGRHLHFTFLSPTTFSSEISMPFPLPRIAFYRLQETWESWSNLHFGNLNDWIARAVNVKDFRLYPRTVYLRGMRGGAVTAAVGEVTYEIAYPGDVEPQFIRLLADYAHFAGLGAHTIYGLGHVQVSGWQTAPITQKNTHDDLPFTHWRNE